MVNQNPTHERKHDVWKRVDRVKEIEVVLVCCIVRSEPLPQLYVQRLFGAKEKSFSFRQYGDSYGRAMTFKGTGPTPGMS